MKSIDESIQDVLKSLTTAVTNLTAKVDDFANVTADLTTQVSIMSSTVTSLTRHVDRMDHRLQDVERHAKLIPSIADAVGQTAGDIDDHEGRLKNLEQKLA